MTDAPLENNTTAPRVLEMHPQWVDNSFIQGSFTDLFASGYKVEASDVFQAHVGLLRNAASGNVTFRVMIRVESGGNTWVGQAVDTYDGQIKTITIPLSAYAGKQADFVLRVDAGPSSGQDWAVWTDARVYRGPPP